MSSRALGLGVVVILLAKRLGELVVDGSLTVDVGVGRRLQLLGPRTWDIAAERERVFELLEAPYMKRQPRAIREKIQVWQRGEDMALAAHRTRVGERTATTVETVRFARPERIDFRLVRGPVPHVIESFELEAAGAHTRLTWSGELGTDFGVVGEWWGRRVALVWTDAVERSIASVKEEAERARGSAGQARGRSGPGGTPAS